MQNVAKCGVMAINENQQLKVSTIMAKKAKMAL